MSTDPRMHRKPDPQLPLPPLLRRVHTVDRCLVWTGGKLVAHDAVGQELAGVAA